MKKKELLYLYLTAAFSTFFIFCLQFYDPPYISERIESKLYDMRLQLRPYIKKQKASEDIVIVYVDEKSLKQVGRWPWSRDVMAGLIDNISKDKPKVIGIDIMFSEPESAKTDTKLAESIKKAGNVVLAGAFLVPTYAVKKNSDGNMEEPPDFLWESAFMNVKSVSGIPWRQWAVRPEQVIPPLREFAVNAALGHVYSHPDLDGVLRWKPLYLNYGDDCYPEISLQAARIALGIKMEDVVLFGGSAIKLGDKYIKTDISGRVLINYRDYEDYRSVSAADVISGVVKDGFFKDRIVFIGTSALATYDHKTTPLSANSPGVSVNANIADNIIADNFLKKSPGVIELLCIVITGFLLGYLLPKLKALKGSVIALSLIVFYVTAAFYLLIYENLWINLFYPASNMFLIFINQTLFKYLLEEKRAKEVRSIFSRYVAPSIVDKLIDDPASTRLGGEIREVSVLFSDIVGFTSMSEKMSPDEVVKRLNEYFTCMVDIVFEHKGTINKFIGDAIMASWGAPIRQPNHAELAVKCALNMVEKIKELQQKWSKEGKHIIDIGIGINSGEVLVGNIGAEGKQMDYTVMGDAVNLSSRIESLTRKYNAHLLISEYTVDKIKDAVNSNALEGVCVKGVDMVAVKGKAVPVKIYEVTSLAEGEKSFIEEPEEYELKVLKEK